MTKKELAKAISEELGITSVVALHVVQRVFDGITETPFALDGEGYLTIPNTPGLGVALDREKLARVTRDPSPLFAR